MELFIGQKVRHKDINEGTEAFEIIGLKQGEVLLLLGPSTGVDDIIREGWFPIKGLITQNIWGVWQDPDDDFFERITKNIGPRD